MKFLQIMICSPFFFLMFTGCASKAVDPVRPRWCDTPPAHTQAVLYFVSLSEAYQSEAIARETALGKAPKLVLDYIGSEIEARYTETIKSQGSTEEGMISKAGAELFVQQVSKGIVRNLSPVEWHTEKTPAGKFQVCVLTKISKDSIQNSLREAERKAEQKRQRILSEITALVQASKDLVSKGQVLPALKSLNRAKKRIRQTGVQSDTINLSEVEVAERTITSNIAVTSISPLKLELDSIEKKKDLEIKVVYQGTSRKIPLQGFPLEYRYENVKETATTDLKGIVKHLFQPLPEKKRITVTVAPVESSLESIVSKEALKDLLAKGVTYQIRVKIDDLIPIPLMSDFNIKLWTENNHSSFDISELFKINYSCYTQRCFLKIFAYEDGGPIAVIKDISQKRLTVGKIKSFKLKGDTPGRITLYVIGSADTFPVQLNRNQLINRGDFRGMIKTLRKTAGKIAEFKLVVNIVK